MSAVLKEPRSVDAFIEHRGALRRYLHRRLHDRDQNDTEDLLQEIGIRYWRRVSDPDIPLAYLYGIANHVMADYVMTKNYRSNFEVEDLGDAMEETAGCSMDEVTREIDLEQEVAQLVEPLPCTHRNVLILHKMYGYSYEDVATYLELSIFTVEKYVSQSKAFLRGKRK